MKTFLISLLLSIPLCATNPAFVTSSNLSCTNTSSGLATCTTGNGSISSGNTIFVIVAVGSNTSVSTVVDTAAANTFSQLTGGALNNGSTVRVEIWATALNGSATLTTNGVKVTLTGNSRFSAVVGAYSNGTGLGSAQTGTSSTSPFTSPTITTTASNSLCIVGLSQVASATTWVTTTGTQRQMAPGSTAGANAMLNDNSVVSSGSSCNTVATKANQATAIIAYELKGPASGRSGYPGFVMESKE